MNEHIVVVGGGYGGLLAALRLRRRLGSLARITLVNPRPDFVERIRLHERAAGRAPRPRAIARFLDGTGVELRVATVRAIETAAQRLLLDGGETLAWDRLVWATGSAAAAGPPGAQRHAHQIADEAGALALQRALRDRLHGRLAVVGGGATAIEAATAIAAAFPSLRVTIAAPELLPGQLSPRARTHLARRLSSLGIAVAPVCAAAFEPGAVVPAEGAPLPCDLAVWAGGFVAPSLAREAGLPVDALGRVKVDEHLAVIGHPRLRAVGDAACPEIAMPLGCKTAMPMGAYVGDDLAAEIQGLPRAPFGWRDSILCLALGPGDAVVQRAPVGGALRGRLAAWSKELICRATVAVLALERHAAIYRWPGRRAATLSAPAPGKLAA